MKTHYPFLISEEVLHLDFEFESKGPNGTIRKVVRYELRNAGRSTYFDLGFGDWNDKTKEINHVAITNNHDTNKILATVAATALEFTKKFPDSLYMLSEVHRLERGCIKY